MAEIDRIQDCARPDGLVGVDLMHARRVAARERSGAALLQASGSALPFADASFNLVCQNVVFSSIVDDATRRATACEMLRVLRPGGSMLWYDAARTGSLPLLDATRAARTHLLGLGARP